MAQARDDSQQRRRVTIAIGDERYVLIGDASEEYMQRLATYVDERFVRLQQTFPNVPRHRLAMLTAINLADEVHKLREENEELLGLLEETR